MLCSIPSHTQDAHVEDLEKYLTIVGRPVWILNIVKKLAKVPAFSDTNRQAKEGFGKIE